MACIMCLRDLPVTTHHLICKSMWSKSYFKKRYSNKEMKAKTIEICRDCHDAIHDFMTERELAQNYNTLEKLMAQEKVANFVKWIAGKKSQISKAHKA